LLLDQPSINMLTSLKDSGFEIPSLASSSFLYDPSSSPWGFSGTAGLTANYSAFTNGNLPAPQGAQAAFVQKSGKISQAVNVPAGSYFVSFDAAQRAVNRQTFQVLVDASVVGIFNSLAGIAYTHLTTAPFKMSAGTHTLAIQGTDLNGG